MDKQQTCSSSTIERFLTDQLEPGELEALETHLDTCDDCRAKVQTLAAEEPWWREAREFLSSSGELAGVAAETAAADDGGDPLGFLAPTDDPRMLGRFAGYEISGVIGRGGMGIVLKGFDRSLNRYAAIKVLAPQLATSGAARKRFAREAQAAAAVVHDNVMPIFSVSESGGIPYLVMPYVRGESLQRRLDREGTLSPREILRIASQIAAGLAAAHDQGLVHRDIKPANILLPDGVERVMITDFGLARAVDDLSLTRTGVVAGTPQFMSPEQARGESVDHRSDLFSLGTVMYVMCTGRPPFAADSSYAVLRDISDVKPRPVRDLNPEIPVWLGCVVEKLLAKAPQDRFQQAADLGELLEDALAHLQNPHTALPDQLLRLGRKRTSWHRQAWIAIAIVAVAVAATGVSLVVTFRGPPDAGHDSGTASSSDRQVAAPDSPADSAQPSTSGRLEEVLEWRDESLDELVREAEIIELESRQSFPRYRSKE